MLPSVVAPQIRQTLLDYLQTTFAFTDRHVSEALTALVNDPVAGLFRGPYVSLRLPFLPASAEATLPLELSLPFRPYRHQVRAFERLSTRGQPCPRHTLVTTGTGSGKTECFLFPILDHCLRTIGQRGIKAIVLYPMNALANDQAGRFAREIHSRPELRGRVRVGLYVGEQAEGGDTAHMTDTRVITDRHTLRAEPPDVLLTNYRMLDFLLLRPEDRPLWAHNEGQDVLRYLVLDELHTYDGAQGSDVACLLRRLRGRLNPGATTIGTTGTSSSAETPPNDAYTGFACVGTSATVSTVLPSGASAGAGTSDGFGPSVEADDGLLGFAASIFGVAFDPDSIIREERIAARDFLEDADEGLMARPYPRDPVALAPTAGERFEPYAKRQARLWYGRDLDDPVAAGNFLRRHPLLSHLLYELRHSAQSLDALCDRLARTDPAFAVISATAQPRALESYLAIVSWARLRDTHGATRPLLGVHVHLWLRELRRVLRHVAPDVTLRLADDPGPATKSAALPAYYCRECGHSGWLSVRRKGDTCLSENLTDIYQQYAEASGNLIYLSPGHSGVEGNEGGAWLYPVSLDLRPQKVDAPEGKGGPRGWLPVTLHRRVSATSHRDLQGCPVCETDQALTLLAARGSILGSVTVGQMFSTRLARDAKLLAFSDSVQDASHRAGFFSGRTYRFNLRGAFVSALQQRGDLPLSALGEATLRTADLELDKPRATATLFPPDLQPHAELRAYLDACSNGQRAPRAQTLTDTLVERLGFEAVLELGYNARVGRSLAKVGCVALGIDAEAIEVASKSLATLLCAELPEMVRAQSEAAALPAVRRFVHGVLYRLATRGGIAHPYFYSYCAKGGDPFHLSKDRVPNIAPIAAWQRRPRFACLGTSHRTFDAWLTPPGVHTWVLDWAARALAMDPTGRNEGSAGAASTTDPSSAGVALRVRAAEMRPAINQAYRETARVLKEAGLLLDLCKSKPDTCLGLDPERCKAVYMGDRAGVGAGVGIAVAAGGSASAGGVVMLRCDTCGHALTVPHADAATFDQGTCLSYLCRGRFAPDSRPEQAYYRTIYTSGDVRRIFAQEHTGLLKRKERERVERQFKQGSEAVADAPNLLACTPTLEMGIDIGDLSATMLCSVPPGVGNFLQRIGRAGRETGNALIVTQCRNDRPHDLYYFAAPNDMVSGSMQAPGTFLNAPEVLFRQWLAYCLDAWGRTDQRAFVPTSVAKLLAARKSGGSFPQGFLGYLERHTQALLDGFCALFAGTLRSDTKERLQAAAADLPRRLLAALDETQVQIELLQTYRRRIDERIKKLGGDTRLTEDQRAHQSRELERDRKYIESQLRERNGCNTYQFLVEQGLLPNYAFPEDAVTLHAFIYDIPEAGGGGGRRGRGNGHEKHAWQRPASLALREFAPFNSFYAGARHVHIDRIAAGTRTRSTIAPQVFCSRCSCIVPQAEVTASEPCPRCGDKHFGEQGQVRDVVPLKEVGAREPHNSSLSLDNQEERERANYDTKVVFDVDPQAKRFAWADESTPFGYEFLSKVRLTELNLGLRRASGERMSMCGESLPASGFEICDDCGVVRSPGDDEAESRGEQTRTRHLFRCRSRKDKPSFRRVFLTRQMESEAIRVLLPISTVEVEKRLLNLRAALELGLRLKFRGEPLHLRVEPSSEPCGDGEYRRFLMLYDVVPGGTGYLKELVQQPQAMVQLLRDALAHLQACTCGAEARHDPIASSSPRLRGGDGCYRCLYGRGTSFHLPKLSKQLAIELLAELVAAGPRLVPMPTLSDLTVERVTESELEELFLQRFRELCAKRGYAETLGISDAGRMEYTFTRDKARFVLKLQADVGPADGVAFACRPDFLLQRISEPDGSRSDAPAVAVFCDGYAFHAQRKDGSTIIHDDIKKRCAIARSGKMRVWTLTWEDVQGGDGARATALWGLEGNKAKQTLTRYWREQRPDRGKEDLWTLAPLDLFIFLAGEAPAGDWIALAGGYVAAMLAQAPVRSSEAAFAAARTAVVEQGAAATPLAGEGSEGGSWVGADRTWGEARLLLAMDAEQLKQKKSVEITPDVLRWHVHLDDNEAARRADSFQESWRRFWTLVNVLQPMTDGQLSSQQTVAANVDGDLAPPDALMRMGELPAWLRECSPELWDLLVPLAQAGVPAPDVLVEELGPEDAPEASWGVVECAFTAPRVAILHPDFLTGFDTEAALAAGWRVHVANAALNIDAVAAAIRGPHPHGGVGNE